MPSKTTIRYPDTRLTQRLAARWAAWRDRRCGVMPDPDGATPYLRRLQARSNTLVMAVIHSGLEDLAREGIAPAAETELAGDPPTAPPDDVWARDAAARHAAHTDRETRIRAQTAARCRVLAEQTLHLHRQLADIYAETWQRRTQLPHPRLVPSVDADLDHALSILRSQP